MTPKKPEPLSSNSPVYDFDGGKYVRLEDYQRRVERLTAELRDTTWQDHADHWQKRAKEAEAERDRLQLQTAMDKASNDGLVARYHGLEAAYERLRAALILIANAPVLAAEDAFRFQRWAQTALAGAADETDDTPPIPEEKLSELAAKVTRDAQRYRWLRTYEGGSAMVVNGELLVGEKLDRRIDERLTACPNCGGTGGAHTTACWSGLSVNGDGARHE